MASRDTGITVADATRASIAAATIAAAVSAAAVSAAAVSAAVLVSGHAADPRVPRIARHQRLNWLRLVMTPLVRKYRSRAPGARAESCR
jgi:hypothetical protein